MLIAQITDTHIVEKNEHWLSEPTTKTAERLSKVVSYLNHLTPMPDAVLLTGDATDTGTEDAYAHLKELLSPLKAPLYVIPGNHDCRDQMRSAFSKQPYMPPKGFIHYVIDDYPVRLIGLDTLVPGESFGNICEERFFWLKSVLIKKVEKPTLIFMHHPLSKTGNETFDTILCNATAFFEEFMSSQNNILGIVSGHYHNLCITSYANKLSLTAPSVAPVPYFANPQDDYITALELEDPAITLHKWDGSNHLRSHVIRLKEQVQRIDWSLIKKRES